MAASSLTSSGSTGLAGTLSRGRNRPRTEYPGVNDVRPPSLPALPVRPVSAAGLPAGRSRRGAAAGRRDPARPRGEESPVPAPRARHQKVDTKAAAGATVRVLLADDHPLLREGIKACLGASPGIEVVGEVANGADVLERARALSPDVVLMDLNMPELSGMEATVLLRRELPRVRILVFTIHHEPQYVAQVIRAGAHGYITKDAPPRELVAALRGVGCGGTYFSSEVAQHYLNSQLGVNGRNRGASLQALSARETEVLKLIAEGVGNKQIAVRLGVSPRTVETHRERIMRKLDLHSVAALTRFAIAQGLVGLE